MSMEDAQKQMEEEDEEFIDREDDGTVVLHLNEPLKMRKGQEFVDVDQLRFRKSTGADWLATDKATGDLGKPARLASELTGISMKYLSQLSGDDFLRACRVAGMVGNHRQTGGTQ